MLCFIIPPHILHNIFRNGNNAQKVWAQNAIALSERIRQKRQSFIPQKATTTQDKNRIIYTANHTTTLPGTEIGSETTPPTDISGKQAFGGTGATYDLYLS